MSGAHVHEGQVTVYVITNTVNGKQYVGQTVSSPKTRWYQHVSEAKNGRKGSCALYAAIRKYGAEAFTLNAIAAGASQIELDEAEQQWISQLGTLAPNGYNLKTGGSRGRHTAEARAKMSVSQRNRAPISDVTRAKLSAIHKGKPLSAEHRQKLSNAKTGKPSPLRGRTLSKETRAKISASLAGHTGSNLGRKFSQEWRDKISAGRARAWARKKAA